MSDGYGTWKAWFAWRPVYINRGWLWLTTVERRERDNGVIGSQNHDWWWEYRMPSATNIKRQSK